MATAEEAAPFLKLWPENFIVSKHVLAIADLTHEIKYPLDRGVPSSWVNSGDSGSSWECSNKFLRAVVRMMWDWQTIDSMNWMQLLVMWMLRLKTLLGCTVNLLHLRKSENADVVAAYKLSQTSSEAWVAASRSFLSISHVMGSLGLCSLSPINLLIPTDDPLEQRGLAC